MRKPFEIGDKVRITNPDKGYLQERHPIGSIGAVTGKGREYRCVIDVMDEGSGNKTFSYYPREISIYCRSNADRIRDMTDEQLALFLIEFENTFGEEYEGEMSCLKWLQDPCD